MRRFVKLFALLSTIMLLAAALAGCGGSGEDSQGSSGQAEPKGKVKLGYVEWDSEIASTNVVKEVLESKLGYEVETIAVKAGLMFTGLAQSDFDGIVAAWLPATHADYYEQNKDNFEDLGPNLEGAKIGLVVPAYVDIDSIEDLNSVKDKFDGKIIGIEPGAGIMRATEEAIEQYGLDYELIDSSSAAMAASLKSAVEKNEWIAVTGWTPHWKFARWDLKYLEDPKEIYGGTEHISTLVRLGLKEDMPEVYNFLDNFYWEPADMEAVMVKIQDGMSPEEAAKEWVEENSDKVEAWLK